MPNDYTSNNLPATIPAYSDTADIVQAFKDYHDDISASLALKSTIASPVFTGTVTFGTGATITLPANTVGSGQIADGAITDADINASAAISQSKISGLTNGLAAKAPLDSPQLIGSAKAVNLEVTGTLKGTLTGTADSAKAAANYGNGFTKITVLAGSTGPASPSIGDVWISF